MKLGELLKNEALISAEQLELALARQREGGGMLGAILVELGFVDQATLAAALARKYGIAAVELEDASIDPKLAAAFFRLMPRTRALVLRCFPVALEGRQLTLAMADPIDVSALDEIRSRTHLEVTPVYAPEAAIVEALRKLAPRPRPSYNDLRRRLGDVDLLTGTDTSTLRIQGRAVTGTTLERAGPRYLAAAILVDAARQGASHAHVEVHQHWFTHPLRVRFRVGGRLQSVLRKRSRTVEDLETFRGVIAQLLALGGEDRTVRSRFVSGGEAIEADYALAGIGSAALERLTLTRLAPPELLASTTALTPDRALVHAAERRDAAEVKRLLASGRFAEQQSALNTAFLAAARGGNRDVIELLLRSGADLEARDCGLDALAIAAIGDRAEAVEALLATSAYDEHSRDDALGAAAALGNSRVIGMAARREDLRLGDRLYLAMRCGDDGLFRELLADGIPTDADAEGAIWLAARTANVEGIRVIRERLGPKAIPIRQDVPRPLVTEMSPLFEGVLRSTVSGSFEQVMALRASARAGGGSTPRALNERYADCFRWLERAATERGQPSSPDELASWVETAALVGNDDLVSALLEHGADPNGAGGAVHPPLLNAILARSSESARKLLAAGALLTKDILASGGATLHVAMRSSTRLRWRPEDLPEMLSWASQEGIDDFVPLLARSGAGQLEEDLQSAVESMVNQGGQVLDVSERQLERLPAVLFRPGPFTVLDASGNRLTSVPEELGRLSRLEVINLARNPIEHLPEALADLPRLRVLHLDGNELSRLPTAVTRLTRLRSLGLGNNRLDHLPPELGGLSSLVALDLSFNRFETVPEVLDRIPLKWLRLSGNRLRDLSDRPSLYFSLRRLYLEHCGDARMLEKRLSVAPRLEVLVLDGTQLGELPAWIDELQFLRVLSLRNTGLVRLPHELAALSRLEVLRVGQNPLTALPEALANLPSLAVLDVSNCHLRKIPESILEKNLRQLDTGGNPLD